MADQNNKLIELDEPAVHTHTPPGWPIETIELKPDGKAPKHYGPDAYRFGAALTLSVILPRRGWTLVKRTKNYAYLIPPRGNLKPPFQITIAVPPSEEFLAIARRSFARGESWMGQLGEWPAWYLHERNKNMQKLTRDPTTGAMVAELIEEPPESSLAMGEWGVWEMRATARAGRFGLGHLSPDFQAEHGIGGSAIPRPTLWEGAPKSIELSVYERSPKARRLCIEHYGPTCQACSLNYEEKYGPIGAQLIHVHHVTPLSTIGEAYEVDPIRDLIPLCATCHHVVHSRDPHYSVEEIKAAIALSRAAGAGG